MKTVPKNLIFSASKTRLNCQVGASSLSPCQSDRHQFTSNSYSSPHRRRRKRKRRGERGRGGGERGRGGERGEEEEDDTDTDILLNKQNTVFTHSHKKEKVKETKL